MLDSSVAIAGERSGLACDDLLTSIRNTVGRLEIALSAITVMELEHGVWRAIDPGRANLRRRFLEDLLQAVPAYPVTLEIARRAGRIDAEQRAKGIQIAAADLLIGACALELGYAVGTGNVRHFERIPGLVVKKL